MEWRLLGGGHFFRGFGDFVIMASSSEKLIELRLYAKEGMKQLLKQSQVFSSCQLCQSIDVANNSLSLTKSSITIIFDQPESDATTSIGSTSSRVLLKDHG